MTIKMLFNAVETSLKNARIALSEADRYLDMIKEEVEVLEVKAKKGEGITMETLFTSAEISTGTEKISVGEFLKPRL